MHVMLSKHSTLYSSGCLFNYRKHDKHSLDVQNYDPTEIGNEVFIFLKHFVDSMVIARDSCF